MEGLSLIQMVAVLALPLIFAITVHEAAHGWMAKRLGDKTAEMLGRITLNPLKHIDPVGSVLVPIAAIMITGYPFGWAKPVPVNWDNLHQPKRDMGLVALAGPGANLIMALIWATLVYVGVLLLEHFDWLGLPLMLMGVAGVVINLVLMALNLLPIPPLDGGRVVISLLPQKQALAYSRLEAYGLLIVLILLVSGVLGFILWPLVAFTIELLPASEIVNRLLPFIFNPARS
ncbi:MAG: site-2 protease family protein [Candidatus Thiodiazotropha sp.]